MSERKTRSFGDENIKLKDLTNHPTKALPKSEQKKVVKAVAEKSNFPSREPKKRRKVSPYTTQFGGKCRDGMKELFQDIGEYKNVMTHKH